MIQAIQVLRFHLLELEKVVYSLSVYVYQQRQLCSQPHLQGIHKCSYYDLQYLPSVIMWTWSWRSSQLIMHVNSRRNYTTDSRSLWAK